MINLLNLVIMLMLLVACDSKPKDSAETGPIQTINDSNLEQFMEACDELAECVGAKARYKHFPAQAPSDRWACALTRDDGAQHYIYPRLDEKFGGVEFNGFDNELDICHFAKKTGVHSLEHQKKMKKMWEDFDKANKENERRQKEERLKREKEKEERMDRIEVEK